MKKIMFPALEVGYEFEFFAVKYVGGWHNQKKLVVNAREAAIKALGGSIDQRDGARDGYGIRAIRMPTIITDGACFEIVSPRIFNLDKVANYITKGMECAHEIVSMVCRTDELKGAIVSSESFFTNDPSGGVEFMNPGPVYCSPKLIRNCYDATVREKEKKEGVAMRTRTAGLHLNFSVPEFVAKRDPFANPLICDRFVVKLDELAKHVFSYEHNQEDVINRIAVAQRWGDYVIKKPDATESKRYVVEYRQLPGGAMGPRVASFITIANSIAIELMEKEGIA